MMKRGLFLTHINQFFFRLDIGQRKMTNDKLEMTNEKDNKMRNEKLEMRNEEREGEEGKEGELFDLMGL